MHYTRDKYVNSNLILTGIKLSLTDCVFLLFPSCDVKVFCFCFSNKMALKFCANCKERKSREQKFNLNTGEGSGKHIKLHSRCRDRNYFHVNIVNFSDVPLTVAHST